jgi:hypothetical protein
MQRHRRGDLNKYKPNKYSKAELADHTPAGWTPGYVDPLAKDRDPRRNQKPDR